jgi:hypothetical protein
VKTALDEMIFSYCGFIYTDFYGLKNICYVILNSKRRNRRLHAVHLKPETIIINNYQMKYDMMLGNNFLVGSYRFALSQ